MTTLSSPPSQRSSSPANVDSESNAPTSYAKSAGRTHFWLRRLHSLLGVMFGGYVVVHLTVNATGLWPKVYQQNVDKIQDLQPMLPLIEIVAIFLPLFFHAIYGIYIASAGVKFNTTKYNYGGNYRYFLQRVTAYILLAFLAYHIGTLHHWFGGNFNPHNMAYQTTSAAIKTPYANPLLNYAVMAFYLLGVWSAVFHFANGMWTAAIAWGLTLTATAQKRWGHVCFAMFMGLMVIGTVAWFAFAVIGKPALDESKTWTREPPAEVSHENSVKTEENGLAGGNNKPVVPASAPSTASTTTSTTQQ